MAYFNVDEDYSTDSEDYDYEPSGEDSEDHYVSSGADNEPDDEELKPKKKGTKRQKKQTDTKQPKRRGGIKLDEEEETPNNEEEEENGITKDDIENDKKIIIEETEKKRTESLWSDFLKDTGTTPKPSKTTDSTEDSPPSSNVATSSDVTPAKVEEKVTITKVYNFAGEEVKVLETVAANSKEALQASKSVEETPVDAPSQPAAKPSPASASKPRGGLSSVLGKISGKPKMSVLEKSRLDWKQFTNEEGIEEELQTHNKGKDGYLEKQAFLQRADLRQFEVERGLRMGNRSNR